MRLRQILSKAVLAAGLLLIAADIAFLAAKWVGGYGQRPVAAHAQNGERVAAYYLYGNFRCVTCNEMESMTQAALKEGFPKELADGSLAFAVANYQAPGNERFIKDFGVVAPSLLLVDEKDGKALRWKNLERIWDLSSSRDEYIKYVRAETADFLAGCKAFAPSEPPAPKASSGMFAFALATAFGLGLITAISPCPLTANIAAISFLGRHASSPRKALLYGVLYSTGRTLTYVLLGVVLVSGLLSAPGISAVLSKHMNSFLGPVLILSGLFILELLSLNLGGIPFAGKLQAFAEKGGGVHSFLLGVVLALAFCPTSAALFFGGLMPVALTHSSAILLPGLYGIATGLPVMLFAFVVALASNFAGKLFDDVVVVEKWMRLAAGIVFLGAGIHYSVFSIFLI